MTAPLPPTNPTTSNYIVLSSERQLAGMRARRDTQPARYHQFRSEGRRESAPNMSERTANRVRKPGHIRRSSSCSFGLPTTVQPPETLGVVANPIDTPEHVGNGCGALGRGGNRSLRVLRWMNHPHAHSRFDAPAPYHQSSHRYHGSLLLAMRAGDGPADLC